MCFSAGFFQGTPGSIVECVLFDVSEYGCLCSTLIKW